MSNRIERLREYANPLASPWRGQSTDENNARWSKRAEENSDQSRRARGGAMKLPDTGGPVKLFDTGGPPKCD